jgi:hypothetical protein
MATERTTNPRRAAWLLLAGCVFAVSGRAAAAAPPAPPVAKLLEYKPRQADVSCSTPTPEAAAKCKVEWIEGKGAAGGWLVRDEGGQPLRLFFDTNGDGKIDTLAYYKDGVEVYREIDSKFSGKTDQYRWLNAGGMKWGVDPTGDGRIKSWKAISQEEVSQELLQALIKKDAARFQALLITEDEIAGLRLPAEPTAKMREGVKNAPAKFQETSGKLTKLTPSSTWLHLETAAPQCLPAEQGSGRADVVRHAKGTVLVDVGNSNEWVQTGELVKVGDAWRLTSGPSAGPSEGGSDELAKSLSPEVQKLIDELVALDKQAPPMTGGADAASAAHHLKRADLLEKIQAAVKDDREPWVRQLADSLSAAAQSSAAGDTRALTRLTALEQQLAKALPGHNLTAYVTFREMQSDNSMKSVAPQADLAKVQAEWVDRLTKFVSTYPKADDAPEAMLQLGIIAESVGNKNVEAKNWYAQTAKNYADKPQGAKAAGAVRRLELEGQTLALSSPTLKDPNTVFDVAQMRGKVVVVYFWASWNSLSATEFPKLKTILDANKGVELVCVNLDAQAADAQAFLGRTPAPGIHLYQDKGMDGKLATDYGVLLPPTMFLVGKDGKVVSRNIQVGNLDEEIKKLTK